MRKSKLKVDVKIKVDIESSSKIKSPLIHGKKLSRRVTEPVVENPILVNATKGIIEEPIIASPTERVVAIVYDGMLILALLFLVGTVLTIIGTLLTMQTGTESSQAQSLPTWYQNAIMTPSFILTLVGFYGLFWRRGGQTLGMQTWRLKTVNNAGYLLTWPQSFKRILAACLMPLLCGIIGSLIGGSRAVLLLSAFFGLMFNYIFCLFNRRGLAVQDMLSNTITLKMPKVAQEGLWSGFKNRKQKK